MTFLAPTYLFGLIAAAIPIIIHLISLRQTRQVEFSSLRFIKALEHETIRRLKWRQWLLILLRTLIIVFLVLIFAKPVQQGFIPGWMSGELESRVVIFIDNSASMALETDTGTLLDRARKTVPQIINAFEGQTELEIYQTNPPRRVFKGEPGELSQTRVLSAIEQTDSRDNLWVVVDSILTKLDVSEPNRECFILSDFQSLPDPDTFLDSTVQDTSQPRWRFYCLGQPGPVNNLSIRETKIASQIRLPNHLLKLNTRIANDGEIEKRNIPIELYLNDERVGQVVANFKPGRSKEFMFQAYPGKSGLVHGVMKLPDDDFDPDNRWTFELPIPEQIACTIVGQSAEELYLLELALSSIDNQSGLFLIDSKVIPNPERLYLDESDILILHNPGKLSDKAIEDIQSFLLRGGGIIWFVGGRQLQQDNNRLETALRLPVSLQLIRAADDSYFSVKVADDKNPLLTDLDLRNLETELPQVFSYLKVRMKRGQNSILKLNNNDPFLLEFPSNGSRIFYFTSLMDLKWNDLPMRGLMVPLLHRILILLATDETNTTPVYVDEPKIIRLDQETINSEWSVVMPSGNSALLIPDFNTESLIFRQTSEIGSYEILSDGYPYTSFSAYLHPDEYPSRRADKTAIISSLPPGQARWIEPDRELAEALKEIRYGRSLWRVFLVAAIVLLLLESILGRSRPEALKRPQS